MAPRRGWLPSSWGWLVVGLALAALVLALAACGGDGRGGQPEDPRQELEALSQRWATQTARVTYSFILTAPEGIHSGSLELYWRPPASRLDLSIAPDCGCLSKYPEGQSTLIIRDDNSYRCAVTEGKGQCLPLEIPVGEVVPLAFLRDFTTPEGLRQTIAGQIGLAGVLWSREEIAGRSAGCFSPVENNRGAGGEVQWCFDKDGVPLRLVGTYTDASGTVDFRLEAASVSRTISDVDFEPLYPGT